MPFKRLLCALALFTASTVFGQTSAKPNPPSPAADDYSKEAVIIEKYITRMSFEADGTGTREVDAAVQVVSEAGVQQLAVLQFEYTSEEQSVDIDYVRVRKPSGTVIATPAYNIQDLPADVTRTAPMYSDIHIKHVAVKGLGVGDTLEYAVRFRTIKPAVPGHFWTEYSFEKDQITKDERLEISVPADKYVNLICPDFKPEVKSEGGRRIYTWQSSTLQRKSSEDAEPKSSERPSVQLSTFRSWEEVGKWYDDLQRPQLEATPEMRAKTNELTKGLTTDEEKIRAIYGFVSTKFHYISLSFGIGRYKPHAAEEVFGNEYGDCKDKHTLLASLLKAAGYDAWPVLINSSRKIDPEIPSPAQFDHVITVVARGEKLLWLDSTPEIAPFGALLLGLRDRQALVIPSSKPALLMNTPDSLPYHREESFTADVKLSSDGIVTGHMQESLRGDAEVVFRLAFRNVPEAKWKDLVQNISQRMGFGGDVSNVTANSPEDTSKPFQFSYDYNRKNYSDWENGRITPPLPPMGVEIARVSDVKKPKEPLTLGALGEVVYHATMELPTGYSLTPPKSVDLVESFAEYHSTYKLEKNKFVTVRKLVIKKSEVALSEWENYKTFGKGVFDDVSAFIDLSGEGRASKSDSAGDAGRYFRDGVTAIQSRDTAGAERAFRRAIELDPKYHGAHFNLALCMMFQGREEEALTEMHKEQEVSPDDQKAYEAAAQMLMRRGKDKEALNEWRNLLKNNPENRQAVLAVSSYLQENAQYKDAIDVLAPAVEKIPDSPEIKVQLGLAYIKSGDPGKGKQLLHAALEGDPDYNTLNSVAYSLADANLELEAAEQYARKAVDMVEARSVQTAESDAGLATSNELAMIWDTLGWAYFREGKLEAATDYLKASWTLSQNAEVGGHLAQAYAKAGKKQLAAHTYELAYAAVGMSRTSQKVSFNIRDHYKALTGKESPSVTFTTRRPDGKWTPMPGEELSRMRSFTMEGIKSTKSGNATFSLVLSPSKTEQARFVSGDSLLGQLSTRILQSMKLDSEFPSGSKARIVRRALVVCNTKCNLVLMPLNSQAIVNF